MRERLVYCPAPYRCNTTLRPNSTEACSLKPCAQWQAEDWQEVGHPRVRSLRAVGNTHLPVCDLVVLCELRRWSPAAGSQVCQRAGFCCDAKQPLWEDFHTRNAEKVQHRGLQGEVRWIQLTCFLTCLDPFLSHLPPRAGPVCRKNTMSSRFCDKLKLLGRCSLRSVQKQCCFTCGL